MDTCITSFVDRYRKISRRTGNRLRFLAPPMADRMAILTKMEAILAPLGIHLALCCEKDTRDALPEESTIASAACISAERIMAAHGGHLSLRRDAGQRQAAGCRCNAAVDVGSYTLHPCHHDCIFCYANPARDRRDRP